MLRLHIIIMMGEQSVTVLGPCSLIFFVIRNSACSHGPPGYVTTIAGQSPDDGPHHEGYVDGDGSHAKFSRGAFGILCLPLLPPATAAAPQGGEPRITMVVTDASNSAVRLITGPLLCGR